MSTELNINFDQINALQDGLRSARGCDGKSEWDDSKINWLTRRSLLGEVLDVIEGRSKIVKMFPLLEFTRQIYLPSTITEKFIVQEKFVQDTKGSASVRIAKIEGYHFPKQFLDRVEEAAGNVNLFVWRLKTKAKNSTILAEFKNQNWALTKLPEIFNLMLLQRSGLPGVLLTGLPNIFFIRGNDEKIYVLSLSGVGDPGTTYDWSIGIEPANKGWYWSPETQLITNSLPDSYERKDYPF